MTGFRALTLNVVRGSLRNRTALFFTLLLPIFLMVIFGTIFGNSNVTLNMGVVDQDQSTESHAFISRLQKTGGVSVETGNLNTETDRLRNSHVVLVALIPHGFGAAVAGGPPQRITVTQGTQTSATASVANQVLQQVTAGFISGGATPRVSVAPPHTASVNEVRTIDYYLPSMIAYVVLQAGINFVAISLVDQRARQVLRRFQATPLSSLQILGANIVGAAVTVFLQVIVLILVGMELFHARMYGNWLIAAIPIVVGTAAFVGIGFLLTTAARTSEAARGIASAVAFPMMFLAGVFIPLDQLPSGLQTAVHILPLTWLSDAIHKVMNDGAGVADIAVDLLVLATWAVICFLLAAWRFRWE